MKNAKILAGLLGLAIFSSMIAGISATEYVGIAEGDVFVWELTDGELFVYQKYEITTVTDTLGAISATSTYTMYDVDNDDLITQDDYPFLYFYSEDLMDGLELLGTGVTNETKTYGGLERDCLVFSGIPAYTGGLTIDAATGLMLEMEFSSGTTGSFKLVSWEDEDLEAEYAEEGGGIPGYGLALLGICAVIPIVYSVKKCRK
ncbi:MAG: hypothetical protein ACTSVZ_01330 [Promethearchaeota archaeon]